MTATRREGPEPVVLVVEDEDKLRKLVSAALREAAFRVVEACDAAEALRLLRTEAAHVSGLFTDVHMPGDMTGLELARETRRRWPWIGVLITSGYQLPGTGAMPEGSRFLSKPYRTADVVWHLRDVGTA